MIRCSIVVSISACHAEDPGSIPGGGVFSAKRGSFGGGDDAEKMAKRGSFGGERDAEKIGCVAVTGSSAGRCEQQVPTRPIVG